MARMPFGIKSARQVFQRLLNNISTGLQASQCFVYHRQGSSIQEHTLKLTPVFDRLRQNTLLLHVDNETGVSPNPKKIRATSVKQDSNIPFDGIIGNNFLFQQESAEIN
ncbi:hypothetical protein JTB14_023472 [Gonioctena quinquepunctata]|nr:hypothetical protein JTB14_023472 [Gonioctena quinquepunctata]